MDKRKDDFGGGLKVNKESSVLERPTDQSTSKTFDKYDCSDNGRSVERGRGAGSLVGLLDCGLRRATANAAATTAGDKTESFSFSSLRSALSLLLFS